MAVQKTRQLRQEPTNPETLGLSAGRVEAGTLGLAPLAVLALAIWTPQLQQQEGEWNQQEGEWNHNKQPEHDSDDI